MDNKIIGLLGVISVVATIDAAQATAAANESALPRAQSYAELLDPIPNAAALLRAADAADAKATRSDMQVAQYYHHHHHHHHHRYRYHHHHHRYPYYRHHHHHHHHHGGYHDHY